MKMEAFKIEMFKSVLNTGWVNINDVTAMIGKNESGKTSILKALHKFNPFNRETYIMSKEWPKGRRKERNPYHYVCSVKFELNEDELKEIERICDQKPESSSIKISRNYSGNYLVELDGINITESIDELMQVEFEKIEDTYNAKNLSPNFRTKIKIFLEDAKYNFFRFDGSFFVEKTIKSNLIQHVKQPQQNQTYDDSTYLNEVVSAIIALFNKIKSEPGYAFDLNEFCIQKMPTYIYMDDYRVFKGTANLQEIAQRKNNNNLNEEDKTILTILTLSGLDIDEEVQKISIPDKSERVQDFSDASKTLTNLIENKWKQRKYTVQLQADGNQFFTYIIDDTTNLIPLEDRSKGFQWFFSFDLMFMHESNGDFKNCVILLDEPGLHLHPNAQRDLLERLYAYSQENTLIYTTHLPFMIDLRRPENIKIIAEKDKATIITDDLSAGESDTKFVLESALGMSASTSYIIAHKNLIVEGVDDYWFITKLSNILKTKQDCYLDDDILITASGGASKAAYIATIMIGQNVDVVLMLDSDNAGESAKKQIVDNWLSRYKSESEVATIMIADAINKDNAEAAIEDIFSREFYLKFVQEVYKSQMEENGIDLQIYAENKKNQITKILEGVFKNKGLSFKKDRIAKAINKVLDSEDSLSCIDEETLENAKKLIQAINAAFKK